MASIVPLQPGRAYWVSPPLHPTAVTPTPALKPPARAFPPRHPPPVTLAKQQRRPPASVSLPSP